jgi:hypothetical protein
LNEYTLQIDLSFLSSLNLSWLLHQSWQICSGSANTWVRSPLAEQIVSFPWRYVLWWETIINLQTDFERIITTFISGMWKLCRVYWLTISLLNLKKRVLNQHNIFINGLKGEINYKKTQIQLAIFNNQLNIYLI